MDQDDVRKKRMRLFGRSAEDDAPPAFASPSDVTDHVTAGPAEMSVDAYLVGDIMDETPEAHAVRAMLADLSCAHCKDFTRTAGNLLAHFKCIYTNGQYVQHDSHSCPAVEICVLLCGYDVHTKHNKIPKALSAPQKARPSTIVAASLVNLMGGPASRQSNGIGYGGGDGWYGNGTSDGGWKYQHGSGKRLDDYEPMQKSVATPQRLEHEDDRLAAGIMGALASLLGDSNLPGALPALLYRSSILDRAAGLLVNTSVDDIAGRAALYCQLAAFIRALAASPTTSTVLFTPRKINKAGHNILRIAMGLPTLTAADADERAQPLAQCMVGLRRQCALMAKNAQKLNDDNMSMLCEAIKNAADAVDAANTAKAIPSQVEELTAEAAVADIPSYAVFRNYSLKNAAYSMGGTVGKNRTKCIGKELINLAGSLPDGIFIRYGEDRPDCMKILIVAPKGTPYENGLFEFDLLCPADYPQSPPEMLFRTTGGGSFGFNPNLYADGKVCLSLLGTWTGTPWAPGESTILQVLVSIQAMIFCDHPWSNEPGREGLEDSSQSKAYNRSLHPKTVQLAMLDWLEGKGNSIWRDVVVKHFQEHQGEILATIGKWKDDVPSPQPSNRKGKAKKPTGPFGGYQPLFGQALQGSGQAPGGGGLSLPQNDAQDEGDEDVDLDGVTGFAPPLGAPAPPKPKPKYSSMPFGSGHTLGGSGIPFGTLSSTAATNASGFANPATLHDMPFGYTPSALPGMPFPYTSTSMNPPFAPSAALSQQPPSVSNPFPPMPGYLSPYQGTGWAGQKLGGEDDAQGNERHDSLDVIAEEPDQEEATQDDDTQEEATQDDDTRDEAAQEEVPSELAEFAVKLRQAVQDLSTKARLGVSTYSVDGDWADMDI